MKNLLLVDFETLAWSIGTAVVVFVVAFALVGIVAAIWKWVLALRYVRFNKQKVAVNMTGSQVATKMLEGLGLTDVKVEQLGWFKAIYVGNSYSPRKKSIRLRKNIYDTASLTAVAIAAQKVAIAQRHHEGDKKIAVRAALLKFGYFAPFALIPLVAIGVLLDFVVWNQVGWFSIAFTVFAFLYFISSFVVVILNLKIEKRACKTALEFMKKINLLVDDELEDAQTLYKTYITDYWLEFIYDILYIIWMVLKLITKIAGPRSKK